MNKINLLIVLNILTLVAAIFTSASILIFRPTSLPDQFEPVELSITYNSENQATYVGGIENSVSYNCKLSNIEVENLGWSVPNKTNVLQQTPLNLDIAFTIGTQQGVAKYVIKSSDTYGVVSEFKSCTIGGIKR